MSTDATSQAASTANPLDAVMASLKDSVKLVGTIYAHNVANRTDPKDPMTAALEQLQSDLIDIMGAVSAVRASSAEVRNALMMQLGKELVENFQNSLVAQGKQADEATIKMRELTQTALNPSTPQPAAAQSNTAHPAQATEGAAK